MAVLDWISHQFEMSRILLVLPLFHSPSQQFCHKSPEKTPQMFVLLLLFLLLVERVRRRQNEKDRSTFLSWRWRRPSCSRPNNKKKSKTWTTTTERKSYCWCSDRRAFPCGWWAAWWRHWVTWKRWIHRKTHGPVDWWLMLGGPAEKDGWVGGAVPIIESCGPSIKIFSDVPTRNK